MNTKETYEILIKTEDEQLLQTNYEFSIWKGEEKVLLQRNMKNDSLFDLVEPEHSMSAKIAKTEEEERIRLEYKNTAYSDKDGMIDIVFYWLRVWERKHENVSREELYNPTRIGLPYNAVLEYIPCGDEDVTIEARAGRKGKPFEIIKGDARILKNYYYSNKEFKRKWLWAVAVPKLALGLGAVLYSLYLTMQPDSHMGMKVLTLLLAVGFLIGCGYVAKVVTGVENEELNKESDK